MKIKLYQIAAEKDKRRLVYMRYKFAVEHGGVDATEYEPVFDGDVEAKSLEGVYSLFNHYSTMPEGYCGRSLSVSDVAVTEDGAYFCDSFGFVRLENFEV